MAFKYIVFAACLTAANAGYLNAPVAYAAPAAYAQTAYAAPVAYGGYASGYAAPSVAAIGQNTYRSYGNLGQVSTYSKALDTPYSSVRKTDVRVSNDALAYGAAPVAYGHGYAAPAVSYAAPAYRAAYAAPAVAHTYAAPAAYGAYAAPAAYGAYTAKVAAPVALGVAYSAAPAVAHMSFNGYGINYAY